MAQAQPGQPTMRVIVVPLDAIEVEVPPSSEATWMRFERFRSYAEAARAAEGDETAMARETADGFVLLMRSNRDIIHDPSSWTGPV